MASVTTDSGGRRRIQFTDPNGKRQTIRLGRIPKRAAEAIKTRVEHLLTAQISKQSIDGETAKWVAELDGTLSERLARAGLVRKRESSLLADYLREYIDSRHDVKPLTKKKYETSRRFLIEFFGANRNLRDLTPGNADEWRLQLLSQGLAENTVRKHIAVAKVFFNAAHRKKIIENNPFDDLKSTIQANPDRFYFVTREISEKVLNACPDAQWRLLFALSRFGGLRCPSEHLELTWDDVDWENSRIRVPSPKTEHHSGKGSRSIPIFPEIRPYLEDVYEQAPEGCLYVISRYRDSNSNLRTQLNRIIKKAGLEPWPKIFQNLRSTRQTELAEDFPSHVVCSWIGNSQAVASKHYL